MADKFSKSYKRLKKRRKEKKRVKQQLKEDKPLHEKELFGKASYKFVERNIPAPTFTRHVHITSYIKVVGDRCTEYMEGIGNIERVWHGTSLSSLENIGVRGLKLGRWGLFGGGIYLAPDEAKAIRYAKSMLSGRNNYKALLKCYVARGKVYEAKGHGCR